MRSVSFRITQQSIFVVLIHSQTLWIERTVLEIAAPLPGILRWFEVVDRQTEEIPPVQYACETMQNVENELRQLITIYTHEPKRNLNPFTMRLQGIIDANVQVLILLN